MEIEQRVALEAQDKELVQTLSLRRCDHSAPKERCDHFAPIALRTRGANRMKVDFVFVILVHQSFSIGVTLSFHSS